MSAAVNETRSGFELANDMQIFKEGLTDLQSRLQALEAAARTPPPTSAA
jgi:hypothetical protein